jgi:hypothetical protein
MYPGWINVKYGAGILWDIVVVSICSLIGWPLNHIVIFWKGLYHGYFQMRFQLRRRGCSFIAKSTMGTIHLSDYKHTMRPEGWFGRGELFHGLLVAWFKSHGFFFFSVGTPERVSWRISSQTYRGSCGKKSGSCDNTRFERTLAHSKESRAAQCHQPYNEERSLWKPTETPTVQSLYEYTFRQLAVSCISVTERPTT